MHKETKQKQMTFVDKSQLMIIETEAAFMAYRRSKLQEMLADAKNKTLGDFYNILNHMRYTIAELQPFIKEHVKDLNLENTDMAFNVSQKDYKEINHDVMPYLQDLDSKLWIAADACEDFMFR